MYNADEVYETDPAKKDAEWAGKLVTYFRTYWQPLISHKEAEQNMKIILSRYNMDNVIKMFKDPTKLGMEFLPLAIMEKVRTILVGESVKAGVGANVNSIDPIAEEEKKKDKQLLENRKDIEDVITYMQKSIGLPEYNMKNEKAISGKDPFSGNVEMFDELGLDSGNPNDRGYFMKAWHQLKHEMDAQEIVNSSLAYNEVSENIEEWVNDILGKKVVAKQSYVNEFTGAIEHRTLKPEYTYTIIGTRNDGKDAMCVGYVESSTIGTIIKKLGNSFNLDQDWEDWLRAINTTYQRDYTGIWNSRQEIIKGTPKDCIFISDFLNLRIDLGYVEWKSCDQTKYKSGVDFNGNIVRYPRSVSYEPDTNETGYSSESWYNQSTYKAYYISTGSNTQKLYKFGKLYHQLITGAEDEYSSYSIGFKKLVGPTVAEIAYPYIEIAQEAFTKYRWMVRRAKPKGRSYNYESLVQIAKHMIKKGDTKQQVHEVITMFEEGVNEIFTIPKVDGQRVGGGIVPNQDLPNGLDQTAPMFGQIVDWAVTHIKMDLGINDIREAYSPKQNDVYKLQAAALESSRNATSYIGTTIDWVVKDMAKSSLLFAQDIIKYKSSLAYKFLLQMVGYGPIVSLERLKNVALHRYGIIVNSYSTYIERQKVLQDTDIAFQNGEIGYEIKLVINAIDDYRKASYILAYEKQRAEERKGRDAQVQHDRQMEAIQATNKGRMDEATMKINGEIKKADVTGQWMYKANRDDNETKILLNNNKAGQRADEIDNKADANIRTKSATRSIENQQPIEY